MESIYFLNIKLLLYLLDNRNDNSLYSEYFILILFRTLLILFIVIKLIEKHLILIDENFDNSLNDPLSRKQLGIP